MIIVKSVNSLCFYFWGDFCIELVYILDASAMN